jgi:hypothetical protein
MKNTLLFITIFSFFTTTNAQIVVPQASPKGVLFQTIGLTEVEVNYYRPSMKGRIIFGSLVPFGAIWRTGANENTTISFSTDVTIDGKLLPKGKYALYTIPNPDSWEMIFYSNTSNWGTPEVWDESKVALKASVKAEISDRAVESFTIDIANIETNSGLLELAWEKTFVNLKIDVPTQKIAMENIEKVFEGPTPTDYYTAAQYFFQYNGDLKKCLTYINKACENNPKKPYWYTRLKSQIQAKLGDKKGAVETAKISLEAAKLEKNADYIKLNQDSIEEWSKK